MNKHIIFQMSECLGSPLSSLYKWHSFGQVKARRYFFQEKKKLLLILMFVAIEVYYTCYCELCKCNKMQNSQLIKERIDPWWLIHKLTIEILLQWMCWWGKYIISIHWEFKIVIIILVLYSAHTVGWHYAMCYTL